MSASGWSFPRLKTTSLASTPFRRSASTFSQGIPATFTGQWVTCRVKAAKRTCGRGPVRPGGFPSYPALSGVPFELVEVAQCRAAGPDARGEGAKLVVGDLADRPLDAEVGK